MKRKFSEKSLRSGDAHSIAASGVSEDKGRQTFLDLLNWAVTSMKRSAKRLD